MRASINFVRRQNSQMDKIRICPLGSLMSSGSLYLPNLGLEQNGAYNYTSKLLPIRVARHLLLNNLYITLQSSTEII